MGGRERAREGTAAGRVREELLAYLKGEGIEPRPGTGVRRIIGTALRHAEQALTARIASRSLLRADARGQDGTGRAAYPEGYPAVLAGAGRGTGKSRTAPLQGQARGRCPRA